MKTKWIAIGLVGIVGTAAVATGIHFRKTSGSRPSSRESFENVLSSIRSRTADPDQKLFNEKDLAKLTAEISSGDSSNTGRLVRAGIVFFDIGNASSWNNSDREQFALALIPKLSEKAANPEERKTRILIFQLLRRVLSQLESEKVSQVLSPSIADSKSDVHERALYLELGSFVKPLPSSFAAANERCVFGKDLGVAQACLAMIGNIADESNRKRIVGRLIDDWRKLKEPLHPFAVQAILVQHKLFPEESKDLVSLAARKSSETWQDVFLFGVRELGLESQSQGDLRKVAEKSESPIVRQKARSMLK